MGTTLYAAILAGGRGKRFWPLGRRRKPKPFLRLFGGRTLLRLTFERLLPLCTREKILVVAGREHEGLLRRELPEVPRRNLLLEPASRNTAAAAALAALEVRRRETDSVILVAPADHFIGDPEAFQSAVRRAQPLCRDHLVTFGIRPTSPDTGFGYLQAADPLPGGVGFRVGKFLEKPSRDRAEKLLRKGNVYWNSGIFLWSPERILAAVRENLPRLGQTLESLDRALADGNASLLDRVYGGLENISVDHGVMERSRNVAVLPVSFPWSDVGSWSAVGSLLPERRGRNRSEGKLVAVASSGNVVVHPGGLTALIGVRDLAVVYSEGALLVCPRDRAQEVKEIVEILERGREEEFL